MPKLDPLPGAPSGAPPAPPRDDTAGRAAAPEFLAVARGPVSEAERDRTDAGGAGRGGAPRSPGGPARRFAIAGGRAAYASGPGNRAGGTAGEEAPWSPARRSEGRLAILRGNAAAGCELPVRPFIDQPSARALLQALRTLPTRSRPELESVISQLEGLRQSYALPRATEADASALLTRLRAELRPLPAEATARKPALEEATARAMLDALTGPPPAGRQEIDAAAAQLVGLLGRYELPAGALGQAHGVLRGWEAAIARMPPTPQDRRIIAYLDVLAFAPKGSGLPPLASPADEMGEIATYAARPYLHPAVREAADRALAFVPREAGGREGADVRTGASVWERPSLWSLSSPRLQRSVLGQSEVLLQRFAQGDPAAAALVSTMFGNDPARLRAFAGELAGRAPAGSKLRRLALHVRDTATRAAGDKAPGPLQVPAMRVPARPSRPRPARGEREAMERLLDILSYMSRVQL